MVDDHTLLRRALRALLEQEENLYVIGEAGTGKEAVSQAEKLLPDVILMDITLPDMNGLEATKKIRLKDEKIKIIALTMHGEEKFLLEFLAAGGNGYLHKSTADMELLQAIERVLKGEIHVGIAGVQVLAGNQYIRPIKGETDPEVLSKRELQVLILVASGYTSSEIAKQLFLSPNTIDTYRMRLTNKLNLKSRAEIVEYVTKHNLN